MKMFSFNRSKPDYVILVCFWFLVVIGFVALASASSHVGATEYEDSYFFLKSQLLKGLLPGLIAFLFLGKFLNYRFFKKRWVSVSLLVATIALAALVFTPLGVTVKGATRWLDLGIQFQPAEFLKFSLVVYLASWLSGVSNRQTNFAQGFVPFSIVIGSIAAVLLAQNSTSPVAILIAVSLLMYFMSGAKTKYVAGVLLVGALAIAAMIVVTPYRAQRVLAFLTPEADPTGAGYHILQAKTAIGAGGLGGVGFGQSSVKYVLPEPIGDSIFAVYAEEFGFVGVLVLLGLFLFLILRMFLLSRRAPDRFGSLLLIGFGSLIAIQVITNVGAMSGVLPLTGTPLPFISHGGTQLFVYMAIMGVVVNISRYVSD